MQRNYGMKLTGCFKNLNVKVNNTKLMLWCVLQHSQSSYVFMY